MQSLQLDEPLCVPFMWDSASPLEQSSHPPPSSGPATVKSGGASSSSVASSGLSYAAVAKGAPGQADPKTDEKAVKTQKADKLEALLATLDPKDPLREDLQPQLDQLRNDLRDPRQPGARLDSAVAKKRKAEAKVTKCEEALRQAEDSLRLAKEENAAAESELKAAREAASPTPPPPAHPQGAAGLTLSSDDMVGLTNMLQQCGLLAVAVQGTEEETEGGGNDPGSAHMPMPPKLPGRLRHWQTQLLSASLLKVSPFCKMPVPSSRQSRVGMDHLSERLKLLQPPRSQPISPHKKRKSRPRAQHTQTTQSWTHPPREGWSQTPKWLGKMHRFLPGSLSHHPPCVAHLCRLLWTGPGPCSTWIA